MLAFWWRPLLIGGGLLFAFFIFWASSGLAAGLAAVATGLLIYLVNQLLHLFRLYRWLGRPPQDPPRGVGTWGDTFYLLGKRLKLGEDRQQKAVADLEQLLEATRFLPDGVLILDGNNHILWLNDAAERHLGLSRVRDTGQFLHYLLRHTRFVEWLALEDMDTPLTIKSPALPDTTLAMKMVPMPRGQRMLLSHDITELERVDAMRRDFVANVSHELRTPVTVITGFLEAFEDMPSPDPGEFRKYVGLMLEQSNRIRSLLDDLLTLARLEGDPDVRNETVDVTTMAQQLLQEARSLSQGRHHIALELQSGARLIGNGTEIHSALGNLVTNAVRYTPEGGAITLRWNISGSGGAEFSVIDTGEGIEAQHIPRLTERFYRVDRGRSRASGGTGLGLAIVKHVLQRHQGRLRIDSVVGRGSTFTAAFPVERVIPGTPPAEPPAPPQEAA